MHIIYLQHFVWCVWHIFVPKVCINMGADLWQMAAMDTILATKIISFIYRFYVCHVKKRANSILVPRSLTRFVIELLKSNPLDMDPQILLN